MAPFFWGIILESPLPLGSGGGKQTKPTSSQDKGLKYINPFFCLSCGHGAHSLRVVRMVIYRSAGPSISVILFFLHYRTGIFTRPMSRILFAWEMGTHLGHLTRDLPLARSCRDAGHEVTWVAADTTLAAGLLAGEGFTILKAPALRRSGQSDAPANHAAMLLAHGFDHGANLADAVQAWRDIFRQAQADVMVYNHAPTALLSARVSGLPALVCGTGFEIPPGTPALPGFRPWMAIPEAEHHRTERRLLTTVNRLLQEHAQAPLPRLASLYTTHRPLLTTVPELDPFGPRRDADYIGPVYALPATTSPAWDTTAPGKRIVAYLRPTVAGAEALLESLQARGDQVICAMPGLPPDWPARYHRLHFYPHAIGLDTLLPGADLMISSGASTIGTALLAGVPVLLIPQVIEQYLGGLPLERLGAGRMLGEERTNAICNALLDDVLTSTRYHQAATAFASRHAGHGVAWGLAQLEQRLHRLLQKDNAASGNAQIRQ
jgi:UDP:flavonoid glycosyltransferase YjiC (YdhE family)